VELEVRAEANTSWWSMPIKSRLFTHVISFNPCVVPKGDFPNFACKETEVWNC
jgi:hypothetical protein